MESLPDALVSEVLKHINKTSDKNAFSMVSRRLCAVEADQRVFLRVGCGLNPASEALTSLCIRFPNLTRVEIAYSGWMSNMGKQLDNKGLCALSSHCPKLVDLTLSFCSFINDSGIADLALCKGLRMLRLNFVPGISSNGLLSVASGCKNLCALHLNRCMKVNGVEWLEYLGMHGNLESLSIKNCRGIGQDDLVMLGTGWKRLQHLEFEIDIIYHQYWKIYDQCKMQELRCDKLRELSLVNCSFDPGRPLSYVLRMCKALENLSLHMCTGLENCDFTALSQKSRNLKKISLHLSMGFKLSVFDRGPFELTDDALKELACSCSKLEEFELYLSDGEFPSLFCFTQDGVLNLIQRCPIRVLILNSACFFNDVGMNALCSAHFLEVLELVKCQDVTDEGIMLVMNFQSLKTLKLSKCLGVSDVGLKPLIASGKLDSLIVKDCVQISEAGVQGAARDVSYRQDLSWMY